MVKRVRPEVSNADSETQEPAVERTKYLHVDEEQESQAQTTVIECELPPHQTLSFSDFGAFEDHYQKTHVNRCTECYRNFPTEHFLHLHIAENHDPLNEARRAKGDRTYYCFVEDCDRVCSSPLKRRMHLVDKHLFPKNYDFFIVNSGIDRRHSMLRRDKRSSAPRRRRAASDARNPMDAGASQPRATGQVAHQEAKNALSDAIPSSGSEEHVLTPASNEHDDSMTAITTSMSALRFIPPSIRFGRGKGGGGFSTS